jgi:hypothetical protein
VIESQLSSTIALDLLSWGWFFIGVTNRLEMAQVWTKKKCDKSML